MPKSAQKYKRLIRPFKNLFFLIFIVFSVWMLFFDSNSWFFHNDLNNEIEDIQEEKSYYIESIKKDEEEIKKLSTEEGIEKYGREKYHMKKENEEIYLIEYEDSIAKTKKDE